MRAASTQAPSTSPVTPPSVRPGRAAAPSATATRRGQHAREPAHPVHRTRRARPAARRRPTATSGGTVPDTPEPSPSGRAAGTPRTQARARPARLTATAEGQRSPRRWSHRWRRVRRPTHRPAGAARRRAPRHRRVRRRRDASPPTVARVRPEPPARRRCRQGRPGAARRRPAAKPATASVAVSRGAAPAHHRRTPPRHRPRPPARCQRGERHRDRCHRRADRARRRHRHHGQRAHREPQTVCQHGHGCGFRLGPEDLGEGRHLGQQDRAPRAAPGVRPARPVASPRRMPRSTTGSSPSASRDSTVRRLGRPVSGTPPGRGAGGEALGQHRTGPRDHAVEKGRHAALGGAAQEPGHRRDVRAAHHAEQAQPGRPGAAGPEPARRRPRPACWRASRRRCRCRGRPRRWASSPSAAPTSAATTVVLPMPMSPGTSRSAPASISSSAIVAPAARAASVSSAVNASSAVDRAAAAAHLVLHDLGRGVEQVGVDPEVDHPDPGVVGAGQHVDGRAPAQELVHHHRGHVAGVRRHGVGRRWSPRGRPRRARPRPTAGGVGASRCPARRPARPRAPRADPTPPAASPTRRAGPGLLLGPPRRVRSSRS